MIGELKCRTIVLEHFLGINLDFLGDWEESKSKHTDATIEAPSTKLLAVNPATTPEPTLANLVFITEIAPTTSVAKAEPSTFAIDPNRLVGN